MSIDQIAPEALKLPARERALLAASLWESIEDPFEISVDFDKESAFSRPVFKPSRSFNLNPVIDARSR